jgi:hypothetical protein
VVYAVVKRISPSRKGCHVILPSDFRYKYVRVVLRDQTGAMNTYARKWGNSTHAIVSSEWFGKCVDVVVVK